MHRDEGAARRRAFCIAMVLSAAWMIMPVLSYAASAEPEMMSYKFAVGGDDHYGDTAPPAANLVGNESRAYMAALQRNGIQRFFELGDLTMEQGPSAYAALAEIYNSSGIPYNIVLGNHDLGYFTLGCQSTFGYDGQPYVVEFDSIAFIMLNATAPTSFDDSTISWLGATLDAHKGDICFVMMHIMHYALGYPQVEVYDDAFVKLMEKHADHIGAVVAGHIHEYDRPHPYYVNGVNYVYTGTVGEGYAQMNPEEIYSYLTVEMSRTPEGWDIHLYRKNIHTDAMIVGTEDRYSVEWDLGRDVTAFDALTEFMSSVILGSMTIAMIVVVSSLKRILG